MEWTPSRKTPIGLRLSHAAKVQITISYVIRWTHGAQGSVWATVVFENRVWTLNLESKEIPSHPITEAAPVWPPA